MTRSREGKVTVTSHGQTYVASYLIDGKLMKVTSGSVSKSAQLGMMKATPDVLAQLGNPDMRTPIAQALASPERIESGARRLDLAEVASLHFERPDYARFPCLKLAYEALEVSI